MTVGLGTGSTVAYLLPALARRKLDIYYVATSPVTFDTAQVLGLRVEAFTGIDHLDIAIDGADQSDPDGWLIKGGGGAHTREKIVASASERYVVIVSSNKLVDTLMVPVPSNFWPLVSTLPAVNWATIVSPMRRLVPMVVFWLVIMDHLTSPPSWHVDCLRRQG